MTPGAKRPEQLAIDAANGVGAQKLVNLQERLPDIIKFEIFNDGTKGRLNEKVKHTFQAIKICRSYFD